MRASTAVMASMIAVASATTYTETATADVTVTSCAPEVTNCPYDAEDATVSWEDWNTSSADPTSTDSVTWEDWSSTATPVEPTSTDSVTWEDWSSSTPVEPASTSSTSWEDWSSSTPVAPVSATATSWEDWSATPSVVAPASTSECPAYTATAPPAWFSLLPTEVASSIEAAWTGAPPADWCYYTYSTSTWTTNVPATPVAPVSATSGAWWPTGSPSSPVAAAVAASTGAWSYPGSSTGPAIPAWTGAAVANAGSMALAGLAAAAALVLA